RGLLARALLSQPAARQDGPRRNRRRRSDGARPVLPRDAPAGVAGGAARSRPGTAIRMNASPRVVATEAPSASADRPALRLSGIERPYSDAGSRLTVLKDVELEIMPGEMVALVAPSGAGKSTLLHIAGLLERPDAGSVQIVGRDAGSLSDYERTAIRRVQIGFVYQFHHLLPEFSALENIMMPQLIRGIDRNVARQRASQLLAYMRIRP